MKKPTKSCLLLFIGIAFSAILLSSTDVSAKERSVSFVQLCDPQLGMTDFKEDICSLEQAVKQVNLLAPDFVAICGDLVNGPSSVSYSNFCAIREGFTVPCVCVPGNHDAGLPPKPENLEQYRRLIGPDYSSMSLGSNRFIMIDTSLFRSPMGDETKKQMSWLSDQLSQAQEKKEQIFVFGHYPLFFRERNEPECWQDLPPLQRDELCTLFHRYGVRAMLTGHTHCYVENRDGELLFLSGESTCKNVDGRPLGFRFWQIDAAGNYSHRFIALYRRNRIVPKPAYNPNAETGTVARCISNLRLIDAAKEAAGMQKGALNSTEIQDDLVSGRIKGGLKSLVCPDGGRYTIGHMGEDPQCSMPNHQLPYFYQPEEFIKRSHGQEELRKLMTDDSGR